jgi:phage major head subunit gpT-like protein
MGILKSDKLQEANRTLLDTYETFASTIESQVAPIVTDERVPTEAYTHAFFSGIPDPRVWIGERLVKDVQFKEINGRTYPYETTIAAKIPDINSGIIGKYISQMKDMGSKSARLRDILVARLLNNGSSTSMTVDGITKSITNYDGGATFATHTMDDGSPQSNSLTSSALTHANLLVAYNRMAGFKNDLGQTLGVTPTYLIVPNALYTTAKALVENEFISDGTTTISNVLRGTLTIVKLPELTSDTTWFLAGEKNGMKPFAFYEFEPGVVNVVDDPQSFPVHYKNEVEYGFYANVDACFGPWQLILKSAQ